MASVVRTNVAMTLATLSAPADPSGVSYQAG